MNTATHANPEHLEIVLRSDLELRAWRRDHTHVMLDLRGADLRGADLRHKSINGADLRGADLECARLKGADLRGANLSDANMRGADGFWTLFNHATFCNANLRDTWFPASSFTHADLRGADLRYSDLRGSNFDDADFTSARIESTNLCQTNYPQAIGFYLLTVEGTDGLRVAIDDPSGCCAVVQIRGNQPQMIVGRDTFTLPKARAYWNPDRLPNPELGAKYLAALDNPELAQWIRKEKARLRND
jgi:hypothetical protein